MKAQYSNLSILQGISPEDQELLLFMAKEVRFQAGDLILRDSDVASDFYALVQGWVSIEMEVSTLDLAQLTEDLFNYQDVALDFIQLMTIAKAT